MTQHLSEVVKLLAINYYKNNDLTQQEVANIFNVTKRTLQNWLNAYENNTLSRKKKIGKSYKVKEKHIKLALSIIKKILTYFNSRLMDNVTKKIYRFYNYSTTFRCCNKRSKYY